MTRPAACALLTALVACSVTPPVSTPSPLHETPPADAAIAAAPADAGLVAAPRAPLVATGSLTAIATLPAWDVGAAAQRLVVVDDGFLTASAVDAATGSAAWRVTIESAAAGWHTLHPNGAQIIEWAGEKMHVLDAATGRERATREGAFNGHPRGERRGCWVDITDGVCAERCECRFQLFDCGTGASIGRSYDKAYMEFFPMNEPPSSGCYGGDGTVLGRANQLAIISTEDTKTPSTTPRPAPLGHGAVITAAVDLRTGKEAWLDAHSSGSPPESGVSPDGKTCWLDDGETRELRVVDCATGGPLWRVPAPPAAAAGARVVRMTGFVGGDSIYEQLDHRATRRDARSGKVRWSVELPESTLAWPRGMDVRIPYSAEEPTRFAMLDPATGKTLASVAGDKDTGEVPDHAGGIVLNGKELVELSADGSVHRAAIANAAITLGDHVLAATVGDDVIIVARDDLHELGRVHGHADKLLVEGGLGAGRVAIFEYDGKTIGRVTLFRIGP